MLLPLTRHINHRDLLTLARDWSDTFKHLAEHSNQHFLATPVTALPTGKETGTFLAIDVGGTNLRVGFVELRGENDDASRHDEATKIRRSHEHAWPIEEHMKFDQADDLFAWIGECIAKVVSEALYGDKASLSRNQELQHEIPMGITFSFPMKYVFFPFPSISFSVRRCLVSGSQARASNAVTDEFIFPKARLNLPGHAHAHGQRLRHHIRPQPRPNAPRRLRPP